MGAQQDQQDHQDPQDQAGVLPLAQARQAVCKGCEHKTALGFCAKCGCVLAIKTRFKEQSCPLNKW